VPLKAAVILLLFSQAVVAQPYYTRIRAALGIDFFWIAPSVAVSTHAAFAYKKKSFTNIHAGLGAISKGGFRSPA